VAHDDGLAGKVALVTGASQGIGLATARALAASGARVFANGRDRARLEAIAEVDGEPHLEVLPFDVADPGALRRALAELDERAGRLDVLVANVGQRQRRPIVEITRDDFAALIDVNLVAAYDLVREAGEAMAGRGGGRIVVLSSIAAQRSSMGNVSYGASKGGLEAMVKAFAVEWGPRGVAINGLSPGPIATETNAASVADPVRNDRVVARVPLGRWGRPEEIAAAAVFLCSPAASYVHGHTLIADGGLSVSA
jgi:gluconate 5-dehydrogenase